MFRSITVSTARQWYAKWAFPIYNVLQGVVSCVYVQVHNGEHSRTVVHRVGLFNKTGHITTIISQSDVVQWLQQHQASLGALKGMTARQLGWADKQIKSLPAKTPAIEV